MTCNTVKWQCRLETEPYFPIIMFTLQTSQIRNFSFGTVVLSCSVVAIAVAFYVFLSLTFIKLHERIVLVLDFVDVFDNIYSLSILVFIFLSIFIFKVIRNAHGFFDVVIIIFWCCCCLIRVNKLRAIDMTLGLELIVTQ